MIQHLRTPLIAASALITLGAGPALAAAPTMTSQVASNPLPAGMFIINDFDHPVTPGFTFSGGLVRLGSLGPLNSISSPPPGVLSKYVSVLGNRKATLTSVTPLKRISLYMGSPDSFNSIRFIGAGYDYTLTGNQLWQPIAANAGDWNWGRRLTYDFGGFGVTKVIFASARNSFEFDDLAGSYMRAVPEPTTWAMMLMGFFGLGSMLRNRRRALAA